MVSETSGNNDRTSESDVGVMQKFFQRPFFLSCTIGIPFCLFKLLFGVAAIRRVHRITFSEYLWVACDSLGRC